MTRAKAAPFGWRPTPLEPHPERRPIIDLAGVQAPPADLGIDAIAVLDGRTFMFSNSLGDVPPGSVGGLIHEDTRFVSRWELRLAGRSLALLKAGAVDYHSAVFFLTNAEVPGLPANSLAIRRLRVVRDGTVEEITAFNTTADPIQVELRLACGADFADLFEVRSSVRAAASSGSSSFRRVTSSSC